VKRKGRILCEGSLESKNSELLAVDIVRNAMITFVSLSAVSVECGDCAAVRILAVLRAGVQTMRVAGGADAEPPDRQHSKPGAVRRPGQGLHDRGARLTVGAGGGAGRPHGEAHRGLEYHDVVVPVYARPHAGSTTEFVCPVGRPHQGVLPACPPVHR